MAKTASFVVGIDLGTTNFRHFCHQKWSVFTHMIEDAQQNRTFPSAVFRKNGEWQVGYPEDISIKRATLRCVRRKTFDGTSL